MTTAAWQAYRRAVARGPEGWDAASYGSLSCGMAGVEWVTCVRYATSKRCQG